MTRILPLLLVLAVGCSQPEPPAALSYADATEQAISERFAEAYGTPLASLECPDDLAPSSEPVTCAATAEGVAFDLVVRNDSADPASILADWKATGVLFTERVEAEFEDTLPMLADGPVEVECAGDAVRLIAPGETFECEMTGAGQTETITVEALDNDSFRTSTSLGEAAVLPSEAMSFL